MTSCSATRIKNAAMVFEKKDFKDLIDDFKPYIRYSTLLMDEPQKVEIHLFTDGSLLFKERGDLSIINGDEELQEYIAEKFYENRTFANAFAETILEMSLKFIGKDSKKAIDLSQKEREKATWGIYQSVKKITKTC